MAQEIVARWYSAIPVKQAVARLRFGAEAGTTPDAAKVLAPTQDHILGLTDVPLTISRIPPDKLKAGIQLNRKGKEPLLPTMVQAGQPRQDRKIDLFVFFPRGDAAKPNISVEDNDLELEVKVNDTFKFKRKFNLKKMVFDGKLEI